ncbi:MAG: DUF4398 domain-containing protein [Elusimicrobia bacterium]|nr:DUF4398 domain-containing protein [Elusimicrobiota bacterium]
MSSIEVRQKLALGLTLGSLVFTMACAKPPTQELTEAENSINTAIQAGAEEYAGDELKAAQDTLADANAKVESKDFKGAKVSALEAKAQADAATSLIETNKQAAKTQAEEQANVMKPELEAVQAAAAKVKGKAADQVKADAAALNDQWAAAQSDLEGGQYKAALEKLADAQAKLDALKASIESAKGSKK